MEHLEHGLEQHLRFNMAANGTGSSTPIDMTVAIFRQGKIRGAGCIEARVAPQAAPPGRGLALLVGHKCPEKIRFLRAKNVYGRLDFFSIRLSTSILVE